jgi:hypothetical protein
MIKASGFGKARYLYKAAGFLHLRTARFLIPPGPVPQPACGSGVMVNSIVTKIYTEYIELAFRLLEKN